MIRVLYTLWLRQLKKYIRNRSRIIGSLGQPLLFLVALGYGFGPIYEHAGNGNYINFIAPGVVAMSILFTSVFSGIEVIWDKQFGFLKETLVAPVPRWQIVLGRTLGGATVAMIQGTIVLILTHLIGFHMVNLAYLPVALLFMFLIALLFTSLGTALGSILEDMQGFQLIMNFLVMPTFFLSGALFPLNNLPGPISVITRIDPLTYGVDGLRSTLINVSHFGIATDLVVLAILAVIVLSVCSYLFSKIQV